VRGAGTNMVTRYVLHLTCSKDDPNGNPRRLQLVFLSAGGNNLINDAKQYIHRLITVLEGDNCPETASADAHSFIVTPTSFNEWVKEAEARLPRSQWNKG
jgi:hypothetical protein